MPTYRFVCESCGDFEAWESIHVDSSYAPCPACQGLAQKVFVSPHIAAAALPNRKRVSAPPAGNHNSWEAGRVTDHRGQPMLGEKGTPITTKEYAENRSKYEERRRFLRSHPDPFGAKAAQAAKEGK